jgi:hypothetical protein
MSNIGFLENLARRFQPGLLGIGDENQTIDGKGVKPQPSFPVIGGTTMPADQLPAIVPTNSAPASAPVAPALPAVAAMVPDTDQNSILPSITPSEKRLSEINAKNYEAGVYRNPQTGETTHTPNKPGFTEVVSQPGADRKKKWSMWDKVGSFLDAWAKGGLLAGIQGGTDRNYFSKQKDAQDEARLLPIISNERQKRMQDLQIQNTVHDNRLADEQSRNLAQYRTDVITERSENRKSRDANVKMRTVASMLSKIPNYDPNDPRFGDITKALGEVNLPIAPKDAKKNVRLVQDADTGAWTLTLTDPYSGQQEVRPVTNKDGSQLVTTSSSKVSANAAEGRQESQQQFTLKRDQIAQQLKKELDDYKTKNDEIAAENDQTRKLELIKANEQRQSNIARLQQQLRESLGNE